MGTPPSLRQGNPRYDVVEMKDEAKVEMNVALFENKIVTEDLRNQVYIIERHLKIDEIIIS